MSQALDHPLLDIFTNMASESSANPGNPKPFDSERESASLRVASLQSLNRALSMVTTGGSHNVEHMGISRAMPSLGDNFEDALVYLRSEIIGRNRILTCPFGPRLKVYMDYTASGQGLRFVNDYMTWIRGNFANTHTEDSATGLFMTRALDAARNSIESSVNAQDKFVAICTGTGCSGALLRLQQILGVYIPPSSWKFFGRILEKGSHTAHQERVSLKIVPNCNVVDHRSIAGEIPEWLEAREAVKKKLRDRGELPLVVVGGYEHHSNEISWREGLCDVVRIPLTKTFQLDLKALEKILREHRNGSPSRRIIASISACSNVTGMRTDIPAVSRLLRRFSALYFVDYAASGPYEHIDCNPEGREDLFDGFVLSPHKFLGGEGSCGLLMLRKSVYDSRLPPSFAGGGTVKFVGQHLHSYHDDIIEREDAGTPGALQIYQCAMAFAVKDALGAHNIEEREQHLLADFFSWLKETHPDNVFILGNKDPTLRHSIVSFNVTGPEPLHPRFVTVLLSDLFGLQTRAGCSCAGPQGMDLFGVSALHERVWASYVVGEQRGRVNELEDIGLYSIKPGWCRINLHYTMDDDELWYLKEALSFIVRSGSRFLPLYSFDAITGRWAFDPPKQHEILLSSFSGDEHPMHCFGLKTAMERSSGHTLRNAADRRSMLEWQLRAAEALLIKLPSKPKLAPPPPPFPDMGLPSQGPQPFFVVAEGQVRSMEELGRRMALHSEQILKADIIRPKLSRVVKNSHSTSWAHRLNRKLAACAGGSKQAMVREQAPSLTPGYIVWV